MTQWPYKVERIHILVPKDDPIMADFRQASSTYMNLDVWVRVSGRFDPKGIVSDGEFYLVHLGPISRELQELLDGQSANRP